MKRLPVVSLRILASHLVTAPGLALLVSGLWFDYQTLS